MSKSFIDDKVEAAISQAIRQHQKVDHTDLVPPPGKDCCAELSPDDITFLLARYRSQMITRGLL